MALTENEQRALDEYRNLLLRRFPGQVERLVLFGSKARGEATPSSDIDVLVVLDREEKPSKGGFYPLGLTNPVWREIVGMTFDFLMEYGVDISPTVISKSEYKRGSWLITRIKKEGMELWRKTG